jgi:hypothetical protein
MNGQMANGLIQKCGGRKYNSKILHASLNVGKYTFTLQFQTFSITAYIIKLGLEKFLQFILKKSIHYPKVPQKIYGCT